MPHTGRESLIKGGDSPDARIHQLESEVAMLREELRIISTCACGEVPGPIWEGESTGEIALVMVLKSVPQASLFGRTVHSLPRSGYIPQPRVSAAAPPWETGTTGNDTPKGFDR